ncbi:MAG: hypothetical protein KAR43_14580 [Deltaproteobacteria bacterium]|nr:hypothetical protein [Deltaproteobacteria bacterium]
MKTKLAKKIIAGGLMFLFIFSSPCIAVSWATQEKDKIVKIEPSHFNVVFNDFLGKFQSNFPEKPPPPEKGEFETTSEYETRRINWENNYENAVVDYREKFSKTVPAFELYNLEFKFSRYNADKGCFGNIKSSRFKVVGLNPICEGYEIDASCYYGPMERYAYITINNVCINREKAKALKSITFKLRMRVGFQLIPPYPKSTRGKLKYFFHHVSIYDKTTGKTLFTITDQPLTQNLQ